MGNRPMSSVYSLLRGLTTTNSLSDLVPRISMDIGDTARVVLNGVTLRLVERTPWQVCVLWTLRVSVVVGWSVLAFL